MEMDWPMREKLALTFDGVSTEDIKAEIERIQAETPSDRIEKVQQIFADRLEGKGTLAHLAWLAIEEEVYTPEMLKMMTVFEMLEAELERRGEG